MLVCGSKLYSHTCDRIIVLETTLAALRIRYSSSVNSRGRRSIGLPAGDEHRDRRIVLDEQRAHQSIILRTNATTKARRSRRYTKKPTWNLLLRRLRGSSWSSWFFVFFVVSWFSLSR